MQETIRSYLTTRPGQLSGPMFLMGRGGSDSYSEAQATAAAIDQDDDDWSETYYVVSGGGGAGGDGGDGDNSCPLVGPSDSGNGGSNSTANSTDATGNTLDGVNPDDMAGGPTWENFGEAGGLGVAWAAADNSGMAIINGQPVMIYGESVDADVNLSCTPYTSVQWINEADATGNPHLDLIKDANGNVVNAPFYYEGNGNDLVNPNLSAWSDAPGSYFTDNPGTQHSNFSWDSQATLLG